MRIVFDTNVLIAAFISRGICSDLLEHCAQTHELVTSPFILNEFKDKLTTKFKFTLDESMAAIDLLRSVMLVVEPVQLSSRISRDADDDNILVAAVSGNCDCIVTGDNDLLVLKEFCGIAIIKPSDFPEYEKS